MRQQPAFWWPIERRDDATTAQNTYLEIQIRRGPGAWVYYGVNGSLVPATSLSPLAHGYLVHATADTETLPYPYGYTAWRHIYRYAGAFAAALEAAAIVPSGFAAEWTVSDAGLLTLSVTADDPVEIRLMWGGEYGAATSYAGAASILGLDVDASSYSSAHTAIAGHSHGLYLAADPSASLREASGPLWRDVAATQAVSIYGQVVGTGLGGLYGESMTLSWLTADQRARLEDLLAYGADGGPLTYHTAGVTWADMAMGHTLSVETRKSMRIERVAPGVARYNAPLDLLVRS